MRLPRFKRPIKLNETRIVPRLATIEEVQRFLETLDDAALGEALRPLRERLRRMRTREAQQQKRKAS